MDFVEALRISWRSIKSHKLRSVLTTLGVVIGVATVITFVTLGASLQTDIVQTIAGENADILYVSTGTGTDSGLPNLKGGKPVFTTYDATQIRTLEGIDDVAPLGGITSSQVRYENSSVSDQWITVTTPNYFEMKGYTVVEGRNYVSGQNEVLMNRKAVGMFEQNVSVGEQISFVRAANGEVENATVVGIVELSGDSGDDGQSFIGREPKPSIFAPPDPFYENTRVSPSQNTGQRVYMQLVVEATNRDDVESVQGRIYEYLGTQSDARVLKAESENFEVKTYQQLVNQIRDVTSTFTVYITGVALISLIVGAIGIANIMLVSVTERTREIGIMKAIGAKRRDVLQLFLLESVMLGFMGAIAGTVVGAVGGYVGTELINLPLEVRFQWFAISVLVGIVVGVIAGLYPAWDASRTDPIDALRYE